MNNISFIHFYFLCKKQRNYYFDCHLIRFPTKNAKVHILTNDVDIWLRTKHYESIRRIDHASPIKENGNRKKEHRLSADEKCMELTETLTVEKKAEKVREIAT